MDKILRTAEALRKGGVKFIEVTFNQTKPTCIEDTAQAIRAIRQRYEDLYVGAGTVLTEEQVVAAYEAGAQYIITPNTNVSVIKKASKLNMVTISGALTPTEVVMAYEAGATFVKVFPVVGLGVEYIKAIKAPLSHIPIMAVGGVDLSNMEKFYRAGACGFGIGGCMVNKELIDVGDYEGLYKLAKQYVDATNMLREEIQ